MTSDPLSNLFNITNTIVLPFWLIMIALPRWAWARRLIGSPWIVAPVALIYTALVLPSLPTLLPTLASPDLNALAAALGTPAGTTTVWAHMLALDLFAGRWAYLDAIERKIHPALVALPLFCTLMFGPLGLLLYLLLRLIVGRSRADA
jgi:hypothetical protein